MLVLVKGSLGWPNNSSACVVAALRGADGIHKVLSGPTVYDGIEEALEGNCDGLKTRRR